MSEGQKVGFLWGALVVALDALNDARANIDGRGRAAVVDDVDYAIRLASHALIETRAPVHP